MRVGLIGLGDRTCQLVVAFAATIPDFQIAAYADPQPAGLAVLAQKGIGVGRGYGAHRHMLEREQLDLVVVGSPNHLHLEHIRDCLQSGVRVFAEKPVVRTEAESFELMDLLGRHGRDSVMVGLVLRYAPLYQALRRSMTAGQLGTIMSVEAAEHITPEHGAFFHRDWRRNEANSGGFMLEKCCHDLDLYQGVMGSRARRVASFGGRRFFTPDNSVLNGEAVYHERASRWGGIATPFGSESTLVDHQVALIEYESGASLAFHTNMNVPDAYRRFCIVGTRGTAEGDFVRDQLRVHDARNSELIVEWSARAEGLVGADSSVSVHYGAEEQMGREIHAHLYDGAPLPVTVLDALAAGLTAMKIDDARRTGQVVDLTELWRRFDAYDLARSESEQDNKPMQ